MWFWLLFIAGLIFIYIKVFQPLNFWKERNVEFVKPLPVFGNMVQFAFQRKPFCELVQQFYNSCQDRFIGIHQFMLPTLLIKDVDLIKQIAIKDFNNFVDRGFTSKDKHSLFGKSLLGLQSQKWKDMRSTLSPAFTTSKMRSMFTLISDCSEQFCNYLVENSSPNKHMTIEMKELFRRYANDVIATCAFGIQCDSLKEKNNEFFIMGKRTTDFDGIRSLKFFGFSISPFLMNLFKIKVFDDEISDYFRNIVKTTMETREAKGIIRPDMIHLLMEAKKGKLKYEEASVTTEENTGFATVQESDIGKELSNNRDELTYDDLTAQAIIFFFAGSETIATMICHMANELALNPDIQEKLQAEIDDSLKISNGKITYDNVSQMKYLDMVVSETLRKWPPNPISDRICTKDYIIEPKNTKEKAFNLYKDEIVWFPIFALHRDPNHYPNPEKFDPERFNDENKSKINQMAYIPFGVGPRNCIGSRFALLETKILFVFLLSKFNIVVDGKTEIPLQLNRSNFNITAANGFWLGLKLRNK